MTEIQGKSILVRVSEGSSYRESTVFNVTPFKWVNKGKKVYELFVEMQEKVYCQAGFNERWIRLFVGVR